MTLPSSRSTQVSQIIKAPREIVYRAFVDADAVASWLSPDDMKGHMHTFEPYKDGNFSMSLTYLNPADSTLGKTSADTDTFAGRFVELIPNEKIVQIVAFDSDQAEFAGEMKITWRLTTVDSGTEVTVLFEDIPRGIRLEDNELGSQQSLRKLARFVEQSGTA